MAPSVRLGLDLVDLLSPPSLAGEGPRSGGEGYLVFMSYLFVGRVANFNPAKRNTHVKIG